MVLLYVEYKVAVATFLSLRSDPSMKNLFKPKDYTRSLRLEVGQSLTFSHGSNTLIQLHSGTLSYLLFLLSQCEVLAMGKPLFGWAPSVCECVLNSLPHPEDAIETGRQRWEQGKQQAHELLQVHPETDANYMKRT